MHSYGSDVANEALIARYISKLAQLKKDLVPQLKEVDLSIRNGIKNFNKSPNSAPSAITEDRSYESLVKACYAQGFKFHVTKLEAEVSQDLVGHPSLSSWLDDVGLPQR